MNKYSKRGRKKDVGSLSVWVTVASVYSQASQPSHIGPQVKFHDFCRFYTFSDVGKINTLNY